MSHPLLIPWLNLVSCPGLGPARLLKLSAAFQGREQVSLPVVQSILTGFSAPLRDSVERILAQPGSILSGKVENWLSWAEGRNRHLLTLIEPDYPPLLAQIADPPAILFAEGQVDLAMQPQIAVVGSRNPTPMGAETAESFAAALSDGGFTITSGLAAGIDTAAHQGAMPNLGSTVAVLGSGTDVIYPARNRHLANALRESGLLLSEFPPDTPPKAENFPRRNRIISGLSLGTLVVEASLKSGSLITARLALEQHREVFAIPGSIHNPQTRGCHQLIKQGAKLVETTDDIFEELPGLMSLYPMPEPAPEEVPLAPGSEYVTVGNTVRRVAISPEPEVAPTPYNVPLPQLGSEARDVLEAIGYELTHPDLIVARTGLPVAMVQAHLMGLELGGLVRSEGGGFLRIRH